jgi:hypothetical protein
LRLCLPELRLPVEILSGLQMIGSAYDRFGLFGLMIGSAWAR